MAAETLLLLANDQPLPSCSPSSEKNTTSRFASNTTGHPAYNQQSTTSKSTSFSPNSKSGSPSCNNKTNTKNTDHGPSPMFPQIIGLLSFDTPFLGISPGVIAHGAEGHYKTASSAYNAFSELSSAFGWGGAGAVANSTSPTTTTRTTTTATKVSQPAGLLTNGNNNGDAAASPRWQSWGKYAMFAGAAGAVAAGGAAALYSQRERLTSGWGWISGHLVFVGCVLRGEELRAWVEMMSALSSRNEGVGGGGGAGEDFKAKRKSGEWGNGSRLGNNAFRGSAVFYTILGRGANPNSGGNLGAAKILVDGVGVEKRTFCKLPPSLDKKKQTQQQAPKSIKADGSFGTRGQSAGGGAGSLTWISAINDKATDEITAHTSMFYPRNNPGFYGLGERAKEIVMGWVQKEWYEGSDGPAAGAGQQKASRAAGGVNVNVNEQEHVWVHPHDADDQDEDVRMRDGSVGAEDLESSVVVDKAS